MPRSHLKTTGNTGRKPKEDELEFPPQERGTSILSNITGGGYHGIWEGTSGNQRGFRARAKTLGLIGEKFSPMFVQLESLAGEYYIYASAAFDRYGGGLKEMGVEGV